ncbi:hypothetical protein LCGC14_1210610 [marine sediment metagenome]|uniref:Uncharacterized protein n=1 Tax=marine sediment metagenome TaxID=412755 RepID=A0A0F9PIR5_9ZZZZ
MKKSDTEILKKLGRVDTDKVQAQLDERNEKSDEMLNDLMENMELINPSVWDYDFINSLVDQRENKKNISLAQYEQLLRIYNKQL